MPSGHNGTPLDGQTLSFGRRIELVNELSVRPSHELG
jgi:hypothetical protein